MCKSGDTSEASFAFPGIDKQTLAWCYLTSGHIPNIRSVENSMVILVNTLRPRENGRHFADDTFKRIFLNGNVIISIKISLKFVPKGPINNIAALVQIMAWRRAGDKPLSEPMMVNLPTHICVTRPVGQYCSFTDLSHKDCPI